VISSGDILNMEIELETFGEKCAHVDLVPHPGLSIHFYVTASSPLQAPHSTTSHQIEPRTPEIAKRAQILLWHRVPHAGEPYWHREAYI